MVEWAALEKRYTGNGIGGSNPPASAGSIFNINESRNPYLYFERSSPDFGGMDCIVGIAPQKTVSWKESGRI